MLRSNPSSFITRSSRELGDRSHLGDKAKLQRSLASNIKVHHTWDPRTTVKDSDHGGVFNFDFSKNGSLLGVACERKSVLLFDPFNGQMVAAKTNAHTDCVNCVKFLDDRLFATCSDDTNVALWDARYLKHHVQVFHGHSNWVKNIEYDSNQGMLLTSGFDGCIYTWNINSYSNEENSKRVFSTTGLMRSKLSPDFTKLLISTHEGYIIVVHNLDLTTLGEDLKGFKPNMYHLMQRSQTPLRIGLMFNHVFEQDRNRVEFINDWPTGNDANIVSSIQVHPQGWCVLSRNTDSTEKAEWTCIHDIQDYTEEKKRAPHPWELDGVTPHTSAAHSSSTNTPAFSSVAPSHHGGTAQSNNEGVQNNSTGQLRSSSFSSSTQNPRSDTNQSISSSSTERHSQNNNVQSTVVSSEQVNRPTPQSAESSQSASTGQQSVNNFHARPEAETEGTMQVHDSLIQIRRGGRNSDGQFSFSISVHTASGRTIEFNQEDLDSADDDEFVVEQILSNSNGPTSQNITLIRQQERGNDGNSDEPVNDVAIQNDRLSSSTSSNDSESDNAGEDDNSLNESVDNVGLNHVNRRENDDNSEGHRYGDRSEEGNRDTAMSDIYSDESSNAADVESVDLNVSIGVEDLIDNAAGQQHAESNFNAVDDDDDVFVPYEEEYEPLSDDSDDSNEDTVNRGRNLSRGLFREQLFRSAMGPPSTGVNLHNFQSLHSAYEDFTYARRNSVIRSGNSGQPSVAASHRGQRSDNIQDEDRHLEDPRVNVSLPSNQMPALNSATSQPRTNTFMFVLQSNSGDRRRRILNLSYMDSYTERENSVLQKKIHSNRKRLLGYMEESNMGRGFIKEVAFSSDGRLISSPFGFGLRILSFDSYCNELCDCIPRSPVKLYEVTCSLAHVNCVVATKFSPTHNMVVSGCLDGKIAFHQPIM